MNEEVILLTDKPQFIKLLINNKIDKISTIMGKKLYRVYMSEYEHSDGIDTIEIPYIKSEKSTLFYTTNINNISGYTLKQY